MRICLYYLLTFIIGTLLFISLFHTGLFPGNILFFRGLVLLMVTGIFMALVLIILKRYFSSWGVGAKDIFVSLVLVLSLNLVFFTLVPVTLDRSVSVFLLNYFDQQNRPTTQSEIAQVFQAEYITRDRALERRFSEQISCGNIISQGGNYQITSQGRWTMGLFRLISQLYGITNP